MQKNPELQKTFPSSTKAQWKEVAIRDLKGGDFDRQLVWKTYDGIPVQPFYTSEDIPATTMESPDVSGRSWTNYVEILVNKSKSANQLARKCLETNATGFLFHVTSSDFKDFKTLLDGLDLHRLHISFKSEQPSHLFIKNYFAFSEQQGVSPQELHGFYESDPLENWITRGQVPDFDAFSKVISATSDYPHFYGLVIRSHAFADSGSNTSQEIAFSLNKLVEYTAHLVQNGLVAKTVLSNVLFHSALGSDYFFEMAKLRVLRRLFDEVAACYGLENPEVKILSSSGLWSKSIFDPNVNMLRNTTEAMSAILGGCDALLIQPHDSSFENPTDFSHRIALNITNLLKEEAYLGKVNDPGAGAYYLENLSSDLFTHALELFKEIEAKGGFYQAFESGAISKAIEDVRNAKQQDIISRKKVIVGTNKYPNASEKLAHETVVDVVDPSLLLRPRRSSEPYDKLRLRTIRYYEKTGYSPQVHLACFGNPAMRKARASFSTDFFGTAGFHIAAEVFIDDPLASAKDAAMSQADIVVICSSDQDYEASAEKFTQTFRAHDAKKTLLLAGNPIELMPKLKEAGLDGTIHMKTHAIEFLSQLQDKLFVTPKKS